MDISAEIEIRERISKLEQDSSSTHRRLDNLESITESIHIIAVEVQEMRADLGNVSSRINDIESKPVKRQDLIFSTAITAIVTSIVAFFVGKLFGG